MKKSNNSLIGSTYVNILKDEEGHIKFAYGYEVDDKEVSLNDLAMLNSFIDKIKDIANTTLNRAITQNPCYVPFLFKLWNKKKNLQEN